jgi:hypothetical protein
VSRKLNDLAPTWLLNPRQKWVLSLFVRGADVSIVCKVADALPAMLA